MLELGRAAASGRVEEPWMSTTRATRRAPDRDLAAQLAGMSLTTAEILYRMPDAPALLQSYLWQEYDTAPRFPKLRGFLAFWERELDGPIHSVRVASAQLIRPVEIRAAMEIGLQ